MTGKPLSLLAVSLLSGLIGGFLSASFVAGTPVTAQPAPPEIPKVLSAQEFRLIDHHGNARAVLAFSDEGQPFLHFRDEFDTYRVWVGIAKETGMYVRDVDGKTRLVLSVDEDGAPSLVVRDRQHRTKAFQP